MQGNYDGSKVQFISISSSWAVIWQLFKSSLPGYFMFNEKYQYIFSLYDTSNVEFGSSFIKMLIDTINVKVIVLMICSFFILMRIFDKIKTQDIAIKSKNTIKHIFILLVAFSYMFIPSLPISLTIKYQNGGISPTNYIGYLTAQACYICGVFILAYILILILKKMENKHIAFLLAIVLSAYATPIYTMNSTFAEKHKANFERYLTIEKLFDTNIIKSLQQKKIYSTDIYERSDALAIHKGYWDKWFAKNKGLDLQITQDKNCDVSLFYKNRIFNISDDNKITVLSIGRLNGYYSIQDKTGNYRVVNFKYNDCQKDGEFCRYDFDVKKDKNKTSTPIRKYGFYKDGWLGAVAKTNIRANKSGLLTIKGYYPKKITPDLTGTVIIDGISKKFKITKNNFKLYFKLPKKNDKIHVIIKSDFAFKADIPDERVLSFILTDIR